MVLEARSQGPVRFCWGRSLGALRAPSAPSSRSAPPRRLRRIVLRTTGREASDGDLSGEPCDRLRRAAKECEVPLGQPRPHVGRQESPRVDVVRKESLRHASQHTFCLTLVDGLPALFEPASVPSTPRLRETKSFAEGEARGGSEQREEGTRRVPRNRHDGGLAGDCRRQVARQTPRGHHSHPPTTTSPPTVVPSTSTLVPFGYEIGRHTSCPRWGPTPKKKWLASWKRSGTEIDRNA